MCRCKTCKTLDVESLKVSGEYLVFNSEVKVRLCDLRLLRWKAAFYERGIKPRLETAFYHSQNLSNMVHFPEMLPKAQNSSINETDVQALKS